MHDKVFLSSKDDTITLPPAGGGIIQEVRENEKKKESKIGPNFIISRICRFTFSPFPYGLFTIREFRNGCAHYPS